MNAPCKDCPDRHYLCHSDCERYLAFRKKRDEYIEHRAKENRLLDDLWMASRHSKKKKKKFYKDTTHFY